MNEIPTRYTPKDTEDRLYAFWEEKGYFRAKSDSGKKPFSIVIPPPNVTGILHMGHALNNTIQDILIRYQRMNGREALWMPGTDHAGIATQNVVERSLAKERIKRHDLGREKFLEKVWEWRQQYGSTIIRQLKKLGASCDWQRTRFTMDEDYSRSVLEVFIRLYEKGLIYQADYIINWCPRCTTALSDEEAPYKELEGNLYFIKYPFAEDKEYLTVATTRPETMLGDTAVAVNPKDGRYKKYIGKELILPLVNRRIKVIADEMVDLEFGTGAVKVTPAHDPNDYATGKRHSLEFINVMRPDATMNENAGKYCGMDRLAARKQILEDLGALGLLEKVEPHKISAGHCYRCGTLIEPYLSKQWFVKMAPLAAPAIEAVKKGDIRFHPDRWTKVYLNWMENIRDWCISRQIWWGHRIPVYYCNKCPKVIVAKAAPEKCPDCGSLDLRQDEDVLDTWFSSWLWPFATLGWPKESPDLKFFYPTNVLVTAPEIIFFWVARMIMAGYEFMGDLPFRDVYIHGTVRDIHGKKMSKSLGNVIDPLDIISEYGTDALRFSLIVITSQGQDVFLSKERFEQGRNFANKIWNASRFILTNLNPEKVKVDLCVYFKKEALSLPNRWILSRFYSTLSRVNQALDNFEFNEAANMLYVFFWHEFCDWYLEMIKLNISAEENQIVMYKVLEKFLRVLHPFMPFITEEIWQKLPHEGESIMISAWPHVQKQIIDPSCEEEMETVFGVIKAVRVLRSEIELKPDQKVPVSVFPHTERAAGLLEASRENIIRLSGMESFRIIRENSRPAGVISDLTREADIYVHFQGLIDIEGEKKKIRQKVSKEAQRKLGKEKVANNPEFLKKAEPEIIETMKREISEIQSRIERLERLENELR